MNIDAPDFFAPCRWMTIEELLQEFSHLRPDIERDDSFRFIESGEKEGRAAVDLRNNMRAAYDGQGRLLGLYPKRESISHG